MDAQDPDRLNRNAPVILLAAAMAAAAAVLLSYGSELTFFQDSWQFLMHRRDLSASAIFEPHNEHIVVLPVLVELLTLRLFGMSSMMPELAILVALLLGVAAVLFVYVRRRLGPWPALFAAVLLLFLGPGWQDLLWPFQIGFAGSALFGILALLAAEDEEGRRDLLACACLVISIAFSSLALAFAAAVAVEVWRRRREVGLRRAYVVAAPLLVYAGWYAGWGHAAGNQISAHNVLVSPRYVSEGIVSSLDAVLALGTISGEVVGRSKWGLPLLLVLLAAFAYRQLRRPGLPPGLMPALAAMGTFWFLAAFNVGPGREPYSSRYLYLGGLLLILLAANLLQGVRFNRWGLLAGGAVTAVVAGFNLVPLREGRDFFEEQAVLTRADLAAIEIAERTVDPAFRLTPDVSGTIYLDLEAGEYLQAVDEYGSPAYDPAELAAAPEQARWHADLVLAHALPLNIETGVAAPPDSGRCVRLFGAAAGKPRPIPLDPGETTIHFPAGGPGAIRLRRFARDGYPLVDEGIPGGSTSRLLVPADAVARPWLLQAEASQGVTVCNGTDVAASS